MRISPILVVGALLFAGCTAPTGPKVPAAAPALPQPILAAQALATQRPDHDDGADPQRDLTGAIPLDLPVPAELGGVRVSGGTITITAAGTYRLTGSLADGGLVVATDDTDPVVLLLDGVWISNPSGPAVSVDRAGLVMLVAADGSANSLADGTRYAATGEDAASAAIDATSDLTITGRGSLTVTGNHAGAISVSAGLVVRDLTLGVQAVGDGIRGGDYVVIDSGTVSVVAGRDGVVADHAGPGLGYLALGDPALRVVSGADGLVAAGDVLVAAAELSVTAGGGSAAAVTLGRSPAAVRAGSLLAVDDGILALDAARHAVDSAGAVVVNGGEWTLTAGERGVRAGRELFVTGGNLAVLASGGGLAADTVRVWGGSIEVTSTAAGISAEPADQPSRRPGITIEGGEVTLDTHGAPLAGNGGAELNGGGLVVYAGPTPGEPVTVTGGVLVAGGGGGVLDLPSAGSPQCALAADVHGEAGTLVEFVDPEGAVVATFAGRRPFTGVVASTPDVDPDLAYTVRVDGRDAGPAR